MQRFREAIANDSFLLDLKATDLESIFHHAVNFVVARGQLATEYREEVEQSLLKREAVVNTAIGHACSVPHAYLDVIAEPIVLFIRLARPINLQAADGIPTQYIFLLLAPPGRAQEHLDMLTTIARLMSDDEFRYDLGEAGTKAELLAAIAGFQKRTARPHQDVVRRHSDGVQFTGRFAGGLRQDWARRRRHYFEDFTLGLHSRVLSSIFFLFFACLAPAVTFGGIMGAVTDGQIGAVEMLLATAVGGTIYAIFAGQPMIILGGIGPLLIFTEILFQLCGDWSIPFLPTYGWVGLWTAGFLLLMAVLDASALMRFFTRFTDEIFATLMSLIFIYEAARALIAIFRDGSVTHDTALLSLLLAMGTFYVATTLSRFRRSRYLLPRMRMFLSDFGPTIALAAMTMVAAWMHEVNLHTLAVPTDLGTTTGRAWLVDLGAVPSWVRWSAAGPAALAAVLIFLAQNITARLINSPDNALRHGEAYHWDLAVVGVLVGAASVFGLPWLTAATVRSLAHVRSLATVEDSVGPKGESREHIINVRETRVAALVIHLLMIVSLGFLDWLAEIPMAVLYGLFFYMGVVSLTGNQFFERLTLWVMDSALYPSTHYIRRVPKRVLHLFTAVQLACLAALCWIAEFSSLEILFPLFVALLVPVRFLLNVFVSQEHLAALDAASEPEEELSEWA